MQERHKLALDLAERQARISLLRAKYEALCAKMRGSADDGDGDGGGGGSGEPRSQAYFILRAAQKREELQREGDELDASIRKAEREVKALTATLGHLNQRNSALREALHRVDPSSDEASAVRVLEQQAKEAQDLVFRRKRELAAVATRLEESTTQLTSADDRLATLQHQLTSMAATHGRVVADRDTQLAAVAAMEDRVDAARMRHRERTTAAGGGRDRPTADEAAFVSLGIRECSNSVLFTLGQLAREFPQLQPTLKAGMEALSLRMPTKPPPRPTVGPAATTSAPAAGTPSRAMDVGRPSSASRRSGGVATTAAASGATPSHVRLAGAGAGAGAGVASSPMVVTAGRHIVAGGASIAAAPLSGGAAPAPGRVPTSPMASQTPLASGGARGTQRPPSAMSRGSARSHDSGGGLRGSTVRASSTPRGGGGGTPKGAAGFGSDAGFGISGSSVAAAGAATRSGTASRGSTPGPAGRGGRV